MRSLKITVEASSQHYINLYNQNSSTAGKEFAGEFNRPGEEGFFFTDYAESKIMQIEGSWVIEDSITQQRLALPERINLSDPIKKFIGNQVSTLAEVEAKDARLVGRLREFYVSNVMSATQKQKLLPYVTVGFGPLAYVTAISGSISLSFMDRFPASNRKFQLLAPKVIVKRSDGSYLFNYVASYSSQDQPKRSEGEPQITLSFVISSEGFLQEPLLLIQYDSLAFPDLEGDLKQEISGPSQMVFPGLGIAEASPAEVSTQQGRQAESKALLSPKNKYNKLLLATSIFVLLATALVAALTAAAIIPVFLPAAAMLSALVLTLLVELVAGLVLALSLGVGSLLTKPTECSPKQKTSVFSEPPVASADLGVSAAKPSSVVHQQAVLVSPPAGETLESQQADDQAAEQHHFSR